MLFFLRHGLKGPQKLLPVCGLGGSGDPSKSGSSVLSYPLRSEWPPVCPPNDRMRGFLLRSDLINLGIIMNRDLASGVHGANWH